MPTALEMYYMAQQARAGNQSRKQEAIAQREYERQQREYEAQQASWMGYQNNLNAEYQRKIDEANQKNESRYQDILAGRTDTRDRVKKDLADYGKNQTANANDRYKQLISQAEGDVFSRGFGGSASSLSGARLPAQAQLGRELGDINNDIINRRTNADASLSDSIYGFMERRNDVAPDLNQLIALQQQLGQGGYGGLLAGTPGAPGVPIPGAPADGKSWDGTPLLPNGQRNRYYDSPIGMPNANRGYNPDGSARNTPYMPGPGGAPNNPYDRRNIGRKSGLRTTRAEPIPTQRNLTGYYAGPTQDQQQRMAMYVANAGNQLSSREQGRRALMAQMYEFGEGASGAGSIGAERRKDLRVQALQQGYGTMQPGQTLPLVPGMMGSAVGGGYQYPQFQQPMSLRQGIGYGRRRRQAPNPYQGGWQELPANVAYV